MNDTDKNTRRSAVLFSLPVSIFSGFSILFYGPLSLYLPNAEEFPFGPGIVVGTVAVTSLLFIGLYTLIAYLLPPKVSKAVTSAVFGIFLALYVQGNYANMDYGVLDGTAIQWEYYDRYGAISSAVFLLFLLLPPVFYFVTRRMKKIPTEKALALFAAFVTVIQIPALIFQIASYRPNTNVDLTITEDGIFELSPDENIIIIMLDTMDEGRYTDYLEEHPEFTECLGGFTHYTNVTSSGARTIVAIPSMFTGVPFTREESYSAYKDDVWSRENALSILHDAGYDVGVYSEPTEYSVACMDYVSNFDDSGVRIKSPAGFFEALYRLDLYKFMPHYLKRFFVIDTAEFQKVCDMFSTDNYAVRELYDQTGYTFGNPQRTFRLYHLNGIHVPYTTSSDCRYDPDATIPSTVEGSFYLTRMLLSDLRDQNPEAYENSTIILMADHGDYNVAEHPMFLVKPAGCTEGYSEDASRLSVFDLPIYLCHLAGAEFTPNIYGMDPELVTPDTQRERHIFFNTSNNSRMTIMEYVNAGDAGNPDDTVLYEVHEDDEGADVPYVRGTVLYFDDRETGNAYTVEGFGHNTGWRTRIMGPSGVLRMPVAEPGELRVHIELAPESLTEKHFTIIANGTEVYSDVSTEQMNRDGIDFVIPAEVFSDTDILTLEFFFPVCDPAEMDLPVQERTEEISLFSIVMN